MLYICYTICNNPCRRNITMISIKLNKLLKKYNMNISELSEFTGISRSTLTPLIKSPNDIKGLRIDTVNTLCEFFGSSIDEMLEFKAEKNKYNVFRVWETNHGIIIGIEKKLGSKSRKALLLMSWMFGSSIDETNDISVAISTISLKEASDYDFEKLNKKDLIDGNIFTNDLFKQDDTIIIDTSKILAKLLLKSKVFKSYKNSVHLKEFEPERINISWVTDSKLKPQEGTFIFEIDNNKQLNFLKKSNSAFNNEIKSLLSYEDN